MAVPGDVAVIGFDDLPIARWPVFNLTTVHVAFEEMSEAVVELLLSQLRGDGAVTTGHVFATELILRRTHGTPLD